MTHGINVEFFTHPDTSLYNGLNHGPFSSPQWLEAFQKELLNPAYFLFKEKDKILGSIMGLEVLSRKKVMRKIGLFKNLEFYTGPVLHNEEKTTRCIRALEVKAKELGYFTVRYNSWDHITAYSNILYKHPDPKRNEYVLELEPGPRCFKEKIKKRRRRIIRKARKDGLVLVEDSEKENILLLYKMMNNSKRVRDGKGYSKYHENIIPFLDKQVMENLIDNQILRLFQVSKEGKPLSAVAMLSYGKRAFGLFIGITNEGYQLNASSIMVHDLALKVMDEGKTYLNIGSVPRDQSGDNLRWFKMSLGANEYPVASGKSDFLQKKVYKYIQDIYDTISGQRIAI